jgi:hypothetical protein
MNLLGRRIKAGLSLILALFLFRCEDPNEIGLDIRADSEKVGAFYTEIELPSTVIAYDSILTSSSARLMTGNYMDPDLGQITASGYTRFTYGQTKLSIPEEAIYDSIYLYLNVDYTYGPGIRDLQEFSVHELTEDLIDTAAYFAFSEIGYEADPIAAGGFYFPVDGDTTIYYRVSDDFGNSLFEAAKDTLILDPDDESTLTELYKGFAFLADPLNNSMIRYNQLSEESSLSLYYHEPGDTASKAYRFQFLSTANFNRIIPDRTGTPLEGIEDQPLQEFTPADNKIYLQSGGGLIPKVDLTPIIDFFDTIPNAALNRVVLEVIIDNPGFNEDPPGQLTFYYTNEKNRRIRSGVEFLGIRVEGSNDLVRSPYEAENKNFRVPATLETGDIIPGIVSYNQILLFPPESGFTLTVNHFKADPANIRAKIYYTRLK